MAETAEAAHERALANKPIVGTINVTLALYDEDRGKVAYSVRFPDETGAWSHNSANVRALARDYEAITGKRVALVWHCAADHAYRAERVAR